MVKRLLALDVGERRIGVAVSDPLGLTAQGVETIASRGWKNDIERIASLLTYYETDRLVLGLPRSMNGDIGPQAEKILSFSELLTARGWQVRFQDERLTTSQAHRTLLEGDLSRERRKQVVDKLAAVYILQSFMDGGGWLDEKKNSTRILDTRVWKGMKPMDNNENNMEIDNIIELVDENDNPIRFEHIMTVQYAGDDYVLLAPLDPAEDMDEDELLVLKIENDENGDEIYVSIEDDALVQKVFEKYLEVVESEE